jgi:hypothetical protein
VGSAKVEKTGVNMPPDGGAAIERYWKNPGVPKPSPEKPPARAAMVEARRKAAARKLRRIAHHRVQEIL